MSLQRLLERIDEYEEARASFKRLVAADDEQAQRVALDRCSEAWQRVLESRAECSANTPPK